MVRGLISERSYPWTVEPAGLNSSIWPILSGEGSGGELERCLVLPNDDRRERRSRSNADTMGVCCEFWELNSDDFLFLMCFSLMVYERNQRRTNR